MLDRNTEGEKYNEKHEKSDSVLVLDALNVPHGN